MFASIHDHEIVGSGISLKSLQPYSYHSDSHNFKVACYINKTLSSCWHLYDVKEPGEDRFPADIHGKEVSKGFQISPGLAAMAG